MLTAALNLALIVTIGSGISETRPHDYNSESAAASAKRFGVGNGANPATDSARGGAGTTVVWSIHQQGWCKSLCGWQISVDLILMCAFWPRRAHQFWWRRWTGKQFFVHIFYNCPEDVCRTDTTLVHWEGLIFVDTDVMR